MSHEQPEAVRIELHDNSWGPCYVTLVTGSDSRKFDGQGYDAARHQAALAVLESLPPEVREELGEP